MRKILQYLLRRPLTWMANSLAASPKKEAVYRSLSKLYGSGSKLKNKCIKVLPTELMNAKFIIFSDQHKGNTSWADDFNSCKKNYIAALEYYDKKGFSFINLGDSEELWKFKINDIIAAHEDAFHAEAAFQPHRYFRTFGNHDLIWKNKIDVELFLKKVIQLPLPVYEGIILRGTDLSEKLDVFLTHGHQGDLMSDNNAFSTWIVAHIWMPLQRYLRINVNSPSSDNFLRNKHNKMMYEWSSRKKKLILVTGHTHQPVFASGRYFGHPSNDIPTVTPRMELRPSYFNTGCCCYNDGDITGIEIAEGKIRLVKWFNEEVIPERTILEERSFEDLINDLH